MLLFAFLCIALGVWPQPLYAMLPYPVHFEPYTAAHVLTQLQLLLFSGLAFFVMLGYLKRTPTITLDVDWTWRRLLPALARGIGSTVDAALGALAGVVAAARSALARVIERERLPTGRFVRTVPTASMALWVMLMLAGYLLLYYLR
jgi:multicomponent Na+:H+ antiporter subunit D